MPLKKRAMQKTRIELFQTEYIRSNRVKHAAVNHALRIRRGGRDGF